MRMRPLVCTLVWIVALVASPMGARASMIAVDFDPPTGFQLDYYADDVAGFRFTVGADDIVVTDLGFFDYITPEGAEVGLRDAHPVGIYEWDTQSLVVSATVPEGTAAPLEGQFRFVSIIPTTLAAATDYVVVGYRPSAADPIAFEVSGFVTAPFITYVHDVAANDTGGLAFASEPFGFDPAWFGPNFKADPVPEPSSLALLSAGLLGVCVWMWRRRKQTV